jgi:hypothetical protein
LLGCLLLHADGLLLRAVVHKYPRVTQNAKEMFLFTPITRRVDQHSKPKQQTNICLGPLA